MNGSFATGEFHETNSCGSHHVGCLRSVFKHHYPVAFILDHIRVAFILDHIRHVIVDRQPNHRVQRPQRVALRNKRNKTATISTGPKLLRQFVL